MITEEEKFRAETFRILSLVLLTPAGKVLIDPLLFYSEHEVVYSVLYTTASLIFAIIGFIHIEIARGILDERGTKKWKLEK